jgi:hypothetical protein
MRGMKRWSMAVVAWLCALSQSLAGGTHADGLALAPSSLPRCPGPGAQVVERFVSAGCTDCWAATDSAHAPTHEWLFDWIVPSAQGADAPMSAAALLAAAERAARAKLSEPTRITTTQIVRSRLALRPAMHLRVQSGPAWNGYFGLQMSLGGRAPAGATAWMALVEPLPAGTDGSGVTRELLRSVAGPLPLPHEQTLGRSRDCSPPWGADDVCRRPRGALRTKPVTHLAALRAPESALPERLRARAWIEGADGRILAVASDGCRATAQ